MKTQERRNRIDLLIAELVNLTAEEKKALETPAFLVVDHFEGTVDCFFDINDAEKQAEIYRSERYGKPNPNNIMPEFWERHHGVTVEEYISADNDDGYWFDWAVKNLAKKAGR